LEYKTINKDSGLFALEDESGWVLRECWVERKLEKCVSENKQ